MKNKHYTILPLYCTSQYFTVFQPWPLRSTPLLLLYPASQLITFTCCPSCKSFPSVTATALVTHPDGLSDELCGIIQHHNNALHGKPSTLPSIWHVTWSSLCVAPQPCVSLSSAAVVVTAGLTFIATSGAPLATLTGDSMFQQHWKSGTNPTVVFKLGLQLPYFHYWMILFFLFS